MKSERGLFRRIPPSEVVDLYNRLSPDGSKKIEELCRKITVWNNVVFSEDLAEKSKFWYSPEIAEDHPGHLLTRQKTNTSLMEVARNFLSLRSENRLPDHPYLGNVQYFINQYEEGAELLPIIAVTGRFRSRIFIVDGNTRSLAAAIYKLENGFFPKLPAYLGRSGFLSPLLNLPI